MSERHNLCAACPTPGACCYQEGFTATHHRVATRTPCQFLDMSTGRCTCYQDRHAVNPGCLTIEQMLRDATVPPRCAYIDNQHAYADRPTQLTMETVDTTRRGYGLGFWWFYWRQRARGKRQQTGEGPCPVRA